LRCWWYRATLIGATAEIARAELRWQGETPQGDHLADCVAQIAIIPGSPSSDHPDAVEAVGSEPMLRWLVLALGWHDRVEQFVDPIDLGIERLRDGDVPNLQYGLVGY
jgi:hypothetical protein